MRTRYYTETTSKIPSGYGLVFGGRIVLNELIDIKKLYEVMDQSDLSRFTRSQMEPILNELGHRDEMGILVDQMSELGWLEKTVVNTKVYFSKTTKDYKLKDLDKN